MFFAQYEFLCMGKGKTVNAVAKELGIPSASVTQWKQGSTPRAATVKKIADYFGVTAQYLLYGDLPEESIKEERPIQDGTLSAEQQAAWELLQKMDDDTLHRFINAAKAMLGE